MTSTHETPMSLFSHNKCGTITIKHWELDLFFVLHFTYLGEGVRTHKTYSPLPTGLLIDSGGRAQARSAATGPQHGAQQQMRAVRRRQPRGEAEHRLVPVVRTADCQSAADKISTDRASSGQQTACMPR